MTGRSVPLSWLGNPQAVVISYRGGADVIQQYLAIGVVDELEIALHPYCFGGGRRLFENLREPAPQFRVDKVLDSPYGHTLALCASVRDQMTITVSISIDVPSPCAGCCLLTAPRSASPRSLSLCPA